LIEAVNIVSPRPAIYPTYSTSTSPTMSSQCCDQPTQKPPAKRKYRCSFPGCEKAFTTSGHLSRHYRIHTGEKNYHCLYPGCTSRFSRQDNMMQHYRTHLSPRSRRNRGPLKAPSMEVLPHNFVMPTQHNSIRHAFHPYAPEQWPF
ncbi:transcriptional repressor, partial [Linderina pennispora]